MKINDPRTNAANLGLDKTLTDNKVNQAKTNGEQKPANKSAAPSGDNVTISSMAQQLKNIESSINTAPAFDAEKVNAIKSAIQNGDFTVNTEKVADGLIQSVKDMLNK